MADNTAPIQRGRPFKQGQSGNAKGKPPGARHAALLALDAIGFEGAMDIMHAVVAAARDGDIRPADILLRRLWPERKGRPVLLDMPVIETASDIDLSNDHDRSLRCGLSAGRMFHGSSRARHRNMNMLSRGVNPRTPLFVMAAPRCGARNRNGLACAGPAMTNGRCRFHGGASTGARTAEGLHRCRTVRLKHGGRSAEVMEAAKLRGEADRSAREIERLIRLVDRDVD